jgi:hypothetical protein
MLKGMPLSEERKEPMITTSRQARGITHEFSSGRMGLKGFLFSTEISNGETAKTTTVASCKKLTMP